MARLGRGQPFRPLTKQVMRGTMSFSSTLTETITASDTLIRSAGRALIEAITATDTLLKTIGRTLSDAMLFGPTVNGMTNNSMQGAVAGTPGTLPTNWGFNPSTGLTQQIVGTGTTTATDGSAVDYIDIRFFGTASNGGGDNKYMEGTMTIAALPTDTWTLSAYLALVGGSLAGSVLARLDIVTRTAAGGGTTNANHYSSNITLTSTLTRYSITSANELLTAFVQPATLYSYTTSAAIDFTVRIGSPQLELGSAANPPVRTVGSARGQELLNRGPSRTLIDASTITDTLIRAGGKLLPDAIVASDTLLRTIGRTLSQAVTATGTLVQDIARTLSETSTASDTVLKTAGRTLADTVTVTDSFLRTIARTCSEAISTTAVLIRDVARAFFEAITSADLVIKTAGRILTDAASLFDSHLITTSRVLAESAILTDAVLKSVIRTLQEAIVAADTVVRTVSRSVLESITATDLTIVKTLGRALTDALTLTDTFAYRFLTKMRRGIALLRTTIGKLVLKSRNDKTIL